MVISRRPLTTSGSGMRLGKVIRRLFILLSLAIIAPVASPVSEHGQLAISGFNVVDKNGNPYVLRGMSLFWDIWGFDKFYNSGVVSTLAGTSGTGWGANVVRAAISDFNVNLAKSMIDYTNTSGIYIIIDNHSHCAHKDVSNATNFFSQVSQYVSQKGYKHVMYEVFNEPLYENCNGTTDTQSGGQAISWSTIKNYAKSVIATIRNNDKNGIIFVGTPNYSAGTEAARADPITGYSNIAYSLHFYASQSGHASYRYLLLKGKCNDFPIFITEWGTSEADGNGSFNKSMNDTWMSWVETIGVGWANWSISDKGETSSALTGGAGSNGNWSDGQLTQSGKYVRNIMKGRNAGGSLASVGLTEANVDCSLLNGGSSSQFIRTGIVSFGYSFEAENYLDSSNTVTADVETASLKMVERPQNSSQESKLTYAFQDVPTEKGVYRFEAKVSTTEKTYIYYNFNGGHRDSVECTPTGNNEYTYFKSVIVVPSNSDGVLNVYWKSGASIDAFYTGRLSTKDSVNFGFLDVDDDGNRTVHIPEDLFKEEEVVLPIIQKKEVSSSSVSAQLFGRTLSLVGVVPVQVNVLDIQGRVMLKRQVQGSGALDLSGLRAGAYVVRLKGAGVSETKRIQLR